jgi:tetratricopeptide (TPR) repeat protein
MKNPIRVALGTTFAVVTVVGLVAYRVARSAATSQRATTALAARASADRWNEMGWSFYQSGQYEPALAAFDSAVANVPDFVDAWNYKALALKALGREDEARTTFERALACCERGLREWPSDGTGWGTKGAILVQLGRYAEAVMALSEATKLGPRSADNHALKALALNLLGNQAAAESSARVALDLQPGNPIASAVLQTSKGAE